MKRRSVRFTRGTDVVSGGVDPSARYLPSWHGPDWRLEDANLSWVSNYRTWEDVRHDFLRWFRARVSQWH